MKLDIVFTGVGGQGIVGASDVFCEAAMLEGFDVAKAETHGMAQRGGSVVVHVRIGDQVKSPIIEMGTGDIILSFEILEAVRCLPFLKENGIALINKQLILPVPVIQGLVECPSVEKLIDTAKRKTRQVYEIDGINLSRKAGNLTAVNIVLLGALSVLPENPVSEKTLTETIAHSFKPQYTAVNLKAFQLGRESIT